ncbi:MAG: type II toxin-antitoxin system HicA family toxin [Fimbriimonas ginsengisoli]|uniref:Type II toxin-antitoxin system HicA family toxin n=1 Tax=Fimbriimonas ginsengisoli TaxID=1005039 RepID=A0A931LUF8_FIMGI|nr:type II toxin-antitoxin system HicA family toxin [Fimbriimonas ginsengisoli]MBI3721127.1 type II toxin-antitoxin system HicA family toxin [Fimbriimonas ginsengisoli]
MTVRDIIKLIESDGWVQVRMKGSHRQFKHPGKRGIVTIAGHPSKELPKPTEKSILNQAGLR